MPTDDNDAYGDLDKSNLKFVYEQFLNLEKDFFKACRIVMSVTVNQAYQVNQTLVEAVALTREDVLRTWRS